VLAKFFETLYHKAFVNIVVEGGQTSIYMELCSKTKVVESTQATFETDKVNSELIEFINSYIRETPYFYISVLDMAKDQGVIPTCEKNRLSYYYDLSSSEHKCSDKKWTYYTSKPEIYEIEKVYKEIGVDFIFSPFTLLSNFFKDKISSTLAMYIILQRGYISIAIFDSSELLYGDHLDMEHDASEDILISDDLDDDIELDLEDGIDLEDIDVDSDDMELIDDFGDIEDLDSIEEIDEFSEHKDVEEEFYETEEVIAESDEDSFNEDYQRFSLIQSSIGRYYKDIKYKSSFIENVYIGDGVGVSSDMKRYLEEEMFLNVYIRHLNLAEEVCELAKMEFN